MRKDEKLFLMRVGSQLVKVHLSQPEGFGYWYYRFQWAGKRIYKTTGERDWEAARTVAEKAFLDVSRSEASGDSLPILAVVTRYLEERWPNPVPPGQAKHHATAKKRLTAFASWRHFDVCGLRVEEMRKHIGEYFAHRRKNSMGAYSIKNDQLYLSGFCSWLMKCQIVNWMANPGAAQLHVLDTLEEDIGTPLSPEAQEEGMRACLGDPDLWPLIVLGLGVGMRPAESFRARWEDIDRPGCCISIRGKGGRKRMVEVPEAVIKALPKTKSGPIWPFTEDVAHHRLEKIRTAHELSDAFTLQALRRTTAFRLIQSLTPPEYAVHMGHSLAVASKHYIQLGSLKKVRVLEPASWTVGPGVGQSVGVERTA